MQPAPGKGYGSARGLTNRRGGGLVLLDTEDGVQGIGEAWGPPSVTRACLEVVKPLYVGRSVFAQRGAAQTVLARMYHFGTQNQLIALMGGIDIAAHDAMGKLLNLSVADLIGGRQRERMPVYASGGYFTEADDQDGALAQQLERNAARGFTAFKIKIGRHPAEDAARVTLARRIIGETPLLTVDTNGNYTEDGVLESMRHTVPFDVHWYEEPLAPQDWAGYASLKARAPVSLATGEALYSVFDFRRLIDARLAVDRAARSYAMRRVRRRAYHRHTVRRRASSALATCMGHRHRARGGGAVRCVTAELSAWRTRAVSTAGRVRCRRQCATERDLRRTAALCRRPPGRAAGSRARRGSR